MNINTQKKNVHAHILAHNHIITRYFTCRCTHHEQRVLPEAEARHDTAAVIHCDLDEPLPLPEVQHILVVESSLQNFLNPANNKSDGVPLLQLACDAPFVAADCCMGEKISLCVRVIG
jgi:hypothetical protein